MDEPLQRSLERYDVLDRIAVGGMAEVFLAKAYGAHGFEKTLAIKRILPELARDPEFAARFIAEAKVAVRLSHANVVQVFDFGRIGESLFIAMEYVDGLDLAAMLRKFKDEGRQVPLPAAFHIAIEIVRALDFAHGHNVVHRDISPSNILISRAGEVKIADFGIAVAAQPHQGGSKGPRRVMGKWRYMSPEQTRGDTLDTRSDLFSAASVIYELFTTEKLFPGEEAEDIIKNIADMPIPRMTAIRPNVPSRLDEVLAGALSRKPIDRPTRPAPVLRSLIELSYESSIMATALDVADALGSVIPVRSIAGRGALDDVIRKQLHEGSVARRTAITDGKPSPTETAAGGDVSTGLFRKVDVDGLSRLEVGLEDTQLPKQLVDARDKDRHTEVGGPPTGQVPKDHSVVIKPEQTGGNKLETTQSSRGFPRSLVLLAAILVVGGIGLVVWFVTRPAPAQRVVQPPVPADAAPIVVERQGTLEIDSLPTGGLVSVGGRELGPAPQQTVVDAGVKVRVTIALAGYTTYESDELVEAGKIVRLRPSLAIAPAKLVVTTTPPGATVSVAGQALGPTPLERDVAIGKNVEIRIVKAGFDPISVRSDFVAGKTVTLERELKEAQRFGSVTITIANPNIGWADVYLGGKLLGRNRSATGLTVLQLPVGRHELRVQNPQAQKQTTVVVVVEERKTKAFTATFN